MYIQDKVAEYADEVFTRMDNVRPIPNFNLKGTRTRSLLAWTTYALTLTLT